MQDKEKKIMTLLSLYIAISSISVYLAYNLFIKKIIQNVNYNIYDVITLLVFFIAGIILLISSYRLAFNKDDSRFFGIIGIMLTISNISLIFLYYILVGIDIILIRHYDFIFIFICSSAAFILTIIFSSQKIQKPVFQEKKIMLLFSLYIVILSISFYKFLDFIGRIVVYPDLYQKNLFYIVTILILFASITLLFYIFYSLNKRRIALYFGLTGCIFSGISFSLFELFLAQSSLLDFFIQIPNITVLFLSFVASILTIIYWKKIP